MRRSLGVCVSAIVLCVVLGVWHTLLFAGYRYEPREIWWWFVVRGVFGRGLVMVVDQEKKMVDDRKCDCFQWWLVQEFE